MTEPFNIGQTLAEMAVQAPYRPAIIFPAGRDRQGRARYVQLTFQQLNRLCDQYAHGLAEYGLRRGDRVLMMVRPGLDLIAVTFALLKIGAVPVLIDPGMGRRAFLQCVGEAEPTAMIGLPLAHLIRHLFPGPFRTVQRAVTVGRRWFWGGPTLAGLRSERSEPFPAAPTGPEDEAAIAFTSGGTGIPKGVVYLHGIFRAQINIMRREMNVAEGEVHLAGIYIFALFNPALGVTTVIPEMDPTRPARFDPAPVVEAIQTHGVTMSVGSPVIWQKICAYCLAHEIRLASFKHIFMFGAPVSPDLLERFGPVLAGGRIYTPFGATEALPITMIEADEILAETAVRTAQGAGVCVGRPIGGATVRIIPITDEPIPAWDESLPLPSGQIGEIAVKGPVVTRQYLNRPAQTAAAKIRADDGLWHRMGDLGYLDEAGRLWMCGRKSHRVEMADGLLLPVQCEAIFNQHPAVSRTALVGLGPYGAQRPVLVVQLREEADQQRITAELLALGAEYAHTRPIQTVLFHPDFPVDVRHNAKIQREKLAQWAAGRLG